MIEPSQVLIEKNIVIQNQQCSNIHSFKMKLKYIASKREVNISQALRDIQSNGVPLNNSQIFYMDCEKRVYVFLGNFPSKQQIYLGYEYMIEEVVRLRYKKVSNEIQTQGKTAKFKRKVKQRTIHEVRQSVKQWRRLYNSVDQIGRKNHTLQSAAEIIGIAKKTLDDYYSHLRYAEYFGFDFLKYKDAKIGVLRRFVKSHKQNHKGLMERQFNIVDQFWASSSDSQEDHTQHPF